MWGCCAGLSRLMESEAKRLVEGALAVAKDTVLANRKARAAASRLHALDNTRGTFPAVPGSALCSPGQGVAAPCRGVPPCAQRGAIRRAGRLRMWSAPVRRRSSAILAKHENGQSS